MTTPVELLVANNKLVFPTTIEDLKAMSEKAFALKVADHNDTENATLAKAAQKEVRSIRMELERVRKEGKAGYIAAGKAWDSQAKVLREVIDPMEEHLKEQAEIVSKHQARLKAEAEAAKQAEDARRMAEVEAREKELEDQRLAQEAAQQAIEQEKLALAQAKLDAERAVAQAEREASERIQAEKDLAIKVERERAEAAERLVREAEQAAENKRLAEEAEYNRLIAEKAQAEEDERRAEDTRLEELARRPDFTIARDYLFELCEIEAPVVSDPEAKKHVDAVTEYLFQVRIFLESKVGDAPVAPAGDF